MKTTINFKSLIWVVGFFSSLTATVLEAAPTYQREAEYNYYTLNPFKLAAAEAPCSKDYMPPTYEFLEEAVGPFICTQFKDIEWSSLIDFDDNCTPDYALVVTYLDSLGLNCDQRGDIVTVYRKWCVMDRAGNKTMVTQSIYVYRIFLEDVVLPDHKTYYCPGGGDVSPTATGWPTYKGLPVQHYCGITVDYKDQYNKDCGNAHSITRHWTITDCCNLYATDYDQEIAIIDTTKPIIDCPGPLTFSTNAKHCFAHISLPGIAASDACSPLGLDISMKLNGNTIYHVGDLVILSVGNHSFEYQVKDACGNFTTCIVPVTVYDGQGPLLDCHGLDLCLMTDSVQVGVKDMVNEYWDDCSALKNVKLKIRKFIDLCGDPTDDLVFQDSITICCAGGENTVLVEIQATDAAGNSTYCITSINVISKLPVKIACLDTVKLVGCGIPIPNISPDIIACGLYTLTNKIIFDNRNSSGVGTVIKRFIITTSGGIIDSCQTVFVITAGAPAFGPEDIICPPDTNIMGCNFPNINNFPSIIVKDTSRPCAQVTITLALDTFSLASPCLRIRRTWTIKDALQPALMLMCVQNINIIDTAKPILSGIRDTVLIASGTCNKTYDPPPLIVSDCDANVVVTNTFNGQGANIGSTVFPLGITTIKFRAQDKCGNKDSLTIKITVRDTTGFKIVCQNDTIIACGAAFTPRAPQVLATCTQIATNILTSDTIRNKCSITKINFKRVITDTAGRKDSCAFMVTFRASDTLFCNQITWPNDTSLNTCAKSIHPDSLNLRPIFTYIQSNCSRVVTTFSDSTVATIGAGGCTNTTYRIWSVSDTCAVPPVICRDTQLIRVIDNTAPILTVPKDTCVYLNFKTSCDTLLNFIGTATAADCDPNVVIKSVIIGTTDTFGANLNRRYTKGDTRILVLARDACGNIARDTVLIQVKDTVKPIPACKKTNNYANDQGVIRIHARQFDGGSTDNCSSPANLRFSWTSRLSDTILIVDCNTLRFVRASGDTILDSVFVFPFERNFNLYVTDQSGNQDTCVGNRFLAFFDTLNICNKNLIMNKATVTGTVEMINGKPVPDVNLSAIGHSQYQYMTHKDGSFMFADMFPGMYKMYPFKNDDVALGVSTADLIAIQKHILGVQSFNKTSQFIAADINKDDAVTALDLIELRKLLLGLYDKFPQNTSWRFFDRYLLSRNPDLALMSSLESPFVEAVEEKIAYQNFTAIKIGDINESGTPGLQALESRNNNSTILYLPDWNLMKGQIIEIPVNMDLSNLTGLQAALQFDSDLVDLIGVKPNDPDSQIKEGQYAVSKTDPGLIKFSHIHLAAASSSNTQKLMVLVIKVKQNAMLKQVVRLHKGLIGETYDISGNTYSINLEFDHKSKAPIYATGIQLNQNTPNPMTDETRIQFSIPEAGKVKWSFTDVAGRILASWEKEYPAGAQELRINKSNLNTDGLVIYRMEYKGYTQMRKMIVIE